MSGRIATHKHIIGGFLVQGGGLLGNLNLDVAALQHREVQRLLGYTRPSRAPDEVEGVTMKAKALGHKRAAEAKGECSTQATLSQFYLTRQHIRRSSKLMTGRFLTPKARSARGR